MRPTITTSAGPDKTVTVDVPEERVAEFYAFFGRFLAAEGMRGGRRGGPGHRGRHSRHRCGPEGRRRHDEAPTAEGQGVEPAAPATETPAA